MLYVVCYDIADDQRRQRVAQAMLDYGSRIQESVFLAHLDEELSGRMMARLRRLISELEDRVHVFRLCQACEGEAVALGQAEIRRDSDYIII